MNRNGCYQAILAAEKWHFVVIWRGLTANQDPAE